MGYKEQYSNIACFCIRRQTNEFYYVCKVACYYRAVGKFGNETVSINSDTDIVWVWKYTPGVAYRGFSLPKCLLNMINAPFIAMLIRSEILRQGNEI
jgi:hypothetical protein